MKKSLIFSLSLLALLAVILAAALLLFSGSYIVSFESPDIAYDLVTVDCSNEDIIRVGSAFELDRTSYFVVQAVSEGCADVSISYADSETGESGGEFRFENFRVNSMGMLYHDKLGNGFHYWQAFIIAFALYFLISGFWFLRQYRLHRCENIFDYRVVFELTLLLISFIFAFVFAVSSVLLLTRFTELSAGEAFSLISVTVIFIIAATLPPVLVFSILIGISNLSLIRHEGFRPVNLLGVITGTCLSAGIIVCVFLVWRHHSGIMKDPALITVSNIAALMLLFFELILVSAAYSAYKCLKEKHEYDRDYIIIHGCAIRKDGSLSPLLKGRADAALKFGREQLEKTGREPIYIPSGGQGNDEVISEGEAIKRYLLSKGVDGAHIIAETRSTTTLENMKYSKEIIDSRDANAKIMFATTNYHVFRSGIYASSIGMKAEGIGSPTRWYFWPNAFLREFAGLVVAYRKTELIMGIGMSVVIVLITNLQSILNALS